MIKKCIEFEKVKNAIMGQPPDLHYPSWYMSLIEKIPLINIEENNEVKKMNDMEIASILYKAADAIKWKEHMLSLPTCYNCGKKGNCKHIPSTMRDVRINCPLWKLTDYK